MIGGEQERLERCGQFSGETDREGHTHIKEAMQILEDDESMEVQAALGVLVKLVPVTEGLEDGAEIDGTTKNTSDGVPARLDRMHKHLTIETIHLNELRARMRATEHFTRQLQDLRRELNIILKTIVN